MARKIESAQDVAEGFNEFDEKLTGQETKISEVAEKLTATEAENAELKEKTAKFEQDIKSLIERIESLTVVTKAKGTWKEQDTPDAWAYKLGDLVRNMFEAKYGGSRVAMTRLAELGAVPTLEKRGADGWSEKETVITGAKAGLSSSPLTGDDSVGSYLGSYVIPVEYRAELVRVALDNSAMMPLVNRVSVPGITSYVPTTVDELAFTKLTNQNTDKTEDTFTLARSTLTTEIYAAYIAIVEEFFEDQLIMVGTVIRDMFGEAWGKKFDSLCLEDSTYGALYTSGINTVTMGTGDSAFDNATLADLMEMIKALDTRAKRSGARFYAHPTVWDFLASEQDANGNYRLRQPADGAPMRAHGYPVVLTDGLPDNPNDDAASTKFMAFGNPRYIWNGERVGFEFKIFDQTQSAMESGQIFLRVRTRQAFVNTMPSAWVALLTAAS